MQQCGKWEDLLTDFACVEKVDILMGKVISNHSFFRKSGFAAHMKKTFDADESSIMDFDNKLCRGLYAGLIWTFLTSDRYLAQSNPLRKE